MVIYHFIKYRYFLMHSLRIALPLHFYYSYGTYQE